VGQLHPGRPALTASGTWWLLLAAATAAPAPLPGPDGPLWLGPLPPSAAAVLRAGRGTVTVDPETGALVLEHTDLAVPGVGPSLDVHRTWDGERWWWPWEATLEVDEQGVHLHLPAGVLSAVTDAEQVAGAWPDDTVFTGRALEVTAHPDGWEVVRRALPAHGTVPTPGADRLIESYDEQGRLAERVDAYGQGWRVDRDQDRATAITSHDGRSAQLHQDDEGALSLVQVAGAELYYDHQQDQLTASSSTTRPRTRYTYDDRGALRGVIWPDGAVLRASYDEAGRVAELIGPGPRRSSYTWEDRQVSVRDEVGRLLRIERSAVGDLDRVSVSAPGGRVVRSDWRDGLLVQVEDPMGRAWRVGRDLAGRPTTLEGAGITWRFGWAETGLASVTDPAGGTWGWSRDSRGRATGWTDPEGRRTALERSPAGEVIGVERGGYATRVLRDGSGRVVLIEGATGARTNVRRDGLGRVLGVSDPAGNELVLSGHRDLRPRTLITRLGARWRLSLDLMGRIGRLTGPRGGVLALERNGLGRMARIGDPHGAGTTYDWRDDRRPTRIVDARGGETGFRYDGSGRLTAIGRADQTVLKLERNAIGELTSVTYGDRLVAIVRDVLGRPLEVGPLRYAWDALGGLIEAAAPGLDVALSRAGSGRVRSVRVGQESWRLERDASGRVVAVDGRERVELRRNPAGQIVRVESERSTLRVERDERGLATRQLIGDATWATLRDASGAVLRWSGPDGTFLSTDRDTLGEPTLVHYPEGSSRRDTRETGRRLSVLFDPSGQTLLEHETLIDILGEPARYSDAVSQRVRRGPLGDVVALERPDGTGWSWTPGQLESTSDGALVAYDGEHRPFEALPPVGPAAWGIAVDSLSWLRDEDGAVATLLGDAAALTLEHDALGRLVTLTGETGEAMALQWDAFGRLAGVEDARGSVNLTHGLDRVLGQSTEDQQAWFVSEQGLGWASTDPGRFSIAADGQGHPRVVLDARSLGAERVQWTPVGLPDQRWTFPFGFGGAWSLYSAGPLLDRYGAWDPVSGTRTGATWRPPWAPREEAPGSFPALDGASDPWWSPDVWAADTVWGDPLALMVALQILEPAVEGDWVTLQEAAPALPWLPGSSAGGAAPLGVAEGSIPFDHAPDPLVVAALVAASHPVQSVDSATLIRSVLAEELAGTPPLDVLLDEEPWRRPLALLP